MYAKKGGSNKKLQSFGSNIDEFSSVAFISLINYLFLGVEKCVMLIVAFQ
jgi:hypothetical protein